MNRRIERGLYGITGEKFSRGRGNIFSVQKMIEGGIKTIQYREKEKSIREIVEEVKVIRTMCLEAGVTFIVNDHVDIAILVEADGIHVGQDDMSIKDIRKIVGKKMIIGVSTHSPEQAKKALDEGADYIGVGPIFPTTTKGTKEVGLEYLEHITKNYDIPFVAIGGIKKENISTIIEREPYSICLVSEIVGADDISEMISSLNMKINEKKKEN